ncbi:nicotinate-nucleotide--dimethylbenzimidazole phosphoribosyltransferase [Microlunatus flavus]|uniref:Nicotinate-nucleotide--dimethylbenzimidazole phosphoribosyltransferase n=1 Tax=Microlunatus flavus TaxID=1036181 RepID=A0A1H9NTA3_9ACTN|nr:nicotinate-nucleotide--dimethylbenzimidazole phosphoribosyltransferase [Microlunatus flavus]SER38829.1 nicotinate-nucleotide--dimethylbenzimidazole phosphoribosyltransferase [Microlunatus flavus]
MIAPPSAAAGAAARTRLDGLAKPLGALGRLEDAAAWVAACQDSCPPRPLDRVRLTVLAGDHGVSHDGVSAYPREVTGAMVAAMVAGGSGANVLARQHGVAMQVLDVAVDADLGGLGPAVVRHHLRSSSGAIQREDALGVDEVRTALAVGEALAGEEVTAGADLLLLGDLGIGNTTPAAALVAATFGVGAEEVVGRGTGVDDTALAHKTAVLTDALARVGRRVDDPVERLAALGSADLAVGVGFLVGAARAGVPVLLDGIVTLAELAVAEDLEPGVVAWCAAGHRSTEPAQQLALDKLGLVPLLDLGLRLGEGTGALTALPVLRSAVLLLREMALLADLAPGA